MRSVKKIELSSANSQTCNLVTLDLEVGGSSLVTAVVFFSLDTEETLLHIDSLHPGV